MAATADRKAWTTKPVPASGVMKAAADPMRVRGRFPHGENLHGGNLHGETCEPFTFRIFCNPMNDAVISSTMTRSTLGTRKTRKSCTLSPESITFLEKASKARRAASVSSVLDELIQSVRRAQEREELGQAVTGYYSSLSASEAAEQASWGEFALGEFPLHEFKGNERF